MTQQTVSLPSSSQAQLRQGRIVRGVRSVIRHLILAGTHRLAAADLVLHR